MTEMPRDSPSIKRSFRDLSDAEVADIDKASTLVRLGWTGSFGWDELLRSHRVLIVSEDHTSGLRGSRADRETSADSGFGRG
jgi:hypothetical protein